MPSSNPLWEFITDGMITNPSYPPSIQIPHALASAVSFRTSFSVEQWAKVSPWHKLIGGYFCNGYGGSTVRDMFLGAAPSVVSNPTVPKFWIVCSMLVNYSPNDFVFKTLQTKLHPLRLMMVFGEAVDSATTVCGAFEKGARLHKDSPYAPYVTAGIAVLGGSIVRYFERLGRGQKPTAEWTHPTGGIQRGAIYTLAYAFMRAKLGVRHARLSLTLFHCFITLYGDILGTSLNPAGDLCNAIMTVLDNFKKTFKLGPQPKELFPKQA